MLWKLKTNNNFIKHAIKDLMLISDLTRIIRVRIRQMFNLLQCSWENVFRKAKVFCFVLLRHPVLPGGDALCYLGPGSGRHGKLQKHENERLHGFHPICSIWLVILPGSSRNIFFFVSWFTISSYWTTYSDTSLIWLLPVYSLEWFENEAYAFILFQWCQRKTSWYNYLVALWINHFLCNFL